MTFLAADLASWLPASTMDRVFLVLWALLGTVYWRSYVRQENPLGAYLKVGLMLGFIYGVIRGYDWLAESVPPGEAITFFGLLETPAAEGPRVPFLPSVMTWVLVAFGLLIVWFARNKFGTIGALFLSMWDRGHWYVLPVMFVLMFVGVLLVAAAASPVLSPFIYTLF